MSWASIAWSAWWTNVWRLSRPSKLHRSTTWESFTHTAPLEEQIFHYWTISPLDFNFTPRQSATSPNTMSPSVNPTSLSCRCIPSYISLLKNWQGGQALQCHACTKLSSAAMFSIPPGTLTRAEEWFRSQCEEFNQLADSLR